MQSVRIALANDFGRLRPGLDASEANPLIALLRLWHCVQSLDTGISRQIKDPEQAIGATL